MTTYNDIPVTLGARVGSIEGENFVEAITKNLKGVHERLRNQRAFSGAAGHTLRRILVEDSPAHIKSTRGTRFYRRVVFEYDQMPDVFGRLERNLTYGHDFEVPEEERAGPEKVIWESPTYREPLKKYLLVNKDGGEIDDAMAYNLAEATEILKGRNANMRPTDSVVLESEHYVEDVTQLPPL